MVTPPIVELFRHHLWANLRLLEVCASLDDRVLDEAVLGTAGSIRHTLTHTADAEAGYAATVTETPPPTKLDGFPGIADLRNRLAASGQTILTFVERQDLERVVRGIFRGRPYAYPIGTVLLQAVNHATEHRTHVNVILTSQGVAPVALDGWAFASTAEHQPSTEGLSGTSP